MSILYFIASIAFFIWIARNILFWVALWQVKEYRLDRLLAHFKETSQGKTLLFSPLSLAKWGGIFGYIFVIFNDYSTVPYEVLITAIFLTETVVTLKDIFIRRIKRPTFTLKAILLVVVSFLLISLFYSVSLIQQTFLWLLLLDRITPFIIGFFVFFLSFPTQLYQDYQIDIATNKMKENTRVLVIGVTGSYGKSSTKDYIAQILSKKFVVAKTKGTNNTPIGIASAILREIKPQTEIFVAEMGAYKKGEIAELTQIAKPKIGVLTAIANQHLSLFGSREKLMEAKYELIESLPADGTALFNGNNEGALTLYKKTKMEKLLYMVGYGKEKVQGKTKADIFADLIKVEKKEVSFTVHLDGKTLQLKSPLLGAHTIENILPGVYLAHRLGMSVLEIKNAVMSLTPLQKTMILHTSLNGTAIVDDTFNVNPDGIIAAMNYAKIYKGKKILVLEPMIELGKNGKSEHYRVGKHVSHIADYIFLTKKNFYETFVQGVLENKGKCLVKVASAREIAEFINKNTTRGDVVVFEGKEAALSFNKVV